MPLTLIAAMSENGVIGRSGDLPWRLPEDLKRFKRLTSGHHVIMGRKTYETLGRPLPDRVNIVITRRTDYEAEGVIVVHDLDAALRQAASGGGGGGGAQPFILGGGEIYALALPRVERMELTIVHAHIEGDTYFPEYDSQDWTLTSDERHEPDEKHEYAYSFRTYERKHDDA